MFLDIFEQSLIAITLLVTIYLAYRTSRLEQKSITLKSVEEFSVRITESSNAVNVLLGDTVASGNRVDAKKVIELVEKPETRHIIINYLNAYQSLARGVNLKVYDEKTVRLSRRSDVLRTYNRFEPFIQAYRKRYERESAWLQFEMLVSKWSK